MHGDHEQHAALRSCRCPCWLVPVPRVRLHCAIKREHACLPACSFCQSCAARRRPSPRLRLLQLQHLGVAFGLGAFCYVTIRIGRSSVCDSSVAGVMSNCASSARSTLCMCAVSLLRAWEPLDALAVYVQEETWKPTCSKYQ
jgi:hypothetical protein